MKKIPTLFKRDFMSGLVFNEVTPGCEAVLKGECIPTLKYDGSPVAYINGIWYKRFDAKPGKNIPDGAIACQDPDPITKHWPHWIPLDENDKSNKWFLAAINNTNFLPGNGKTYEAIGPHFQNNPYNLEKDVLMQHGNYIVEMPGFDFDSIEEFLMGEEIEGIVFWYHNQPLCKIKRSDFGFDWNKRR